MLDTKKTSQILHIPLKLLIIYNKILKKCDNNPSKTTWMIFIKIIILK